MLGLISWVLGIVSWVLGIVCWVLGIVCQVSGFVCWVLGFVFWVRIVTDLSADMEEIDRLRKLKKLLERQLPQRLCESSSRTRRRTIECVWS